MATYELKLLNADVLTYEADNVEVTATTVTGIHVGIVQWVVPISQLVSIRKIQ